MAFRPNRWAKCQAQDPEGQQLRSRHRHGREGQPGDPGGGQEEGAEDGQATLVIAQREDSQLGDHGDMVDSMFI